jgi:DNA-binding NarL/FixJ family response regulator
MRDNWPKGLLGFLAYFTDHVLHGFKRPVDWSGVRTLDHATHGLVPLYHDGAVIVLDHQELDVMRLMAKGLGNAAIAESLGLTERAVNKAARKITEGLGFNAADELAAVVTSYGLQ